MSRIVVGVDGSEESLVAVRWAVEEARLRGALVEAVYAYEYSPSWQRYSYGAGEEPFTAEDVNRARASTEQGAEDARERATALVERTVADLQGTKGVRIEPVAVEDRRPARALLERSQDADMLVVGSRGRGGFSGMLMGSVSQQCAQHAECPLVIIR